MKKDSSFEPSFRLLSRMFRVLLRGSVSKTALAQEARINYTRFLKHLVWLEENRIVELSVHRHKIIIRITTKGREFALIHLGNNS